MRLAPDENAPLFSERYFDLTGDERIHFELYRRQQIGICLRYMQGDDEAVARFRIIAVQSASCFSNHTTSGQTVWLEARERQRSRSYIIAAGARERASALCQERTVNHTIEPQETRYLYIVAIRKR